MPAHKLIRNNTDFAVLDLFQNPLGHPDTDHLYSCPLPHIVIRHWTNTHSVEKQSEIMGISVSISPIFTALTLWGQLLMRSSALHINKVGIYAINFQVSATH